MTITPRPAGATPVAMRQENTSQNVIFTFETGAALTGSATAPARRAVIRFSDGTLTNLTTDGIQLVTNMVAWASQGDDVLTTAAGQPLTTALVTSTAVTTCSGTIVCWNLNNPSTTMVDSDNPNGSNSITLATCTPAKFCAPPCTIAGSNDAKTCVKRANNHYTFPGWTNHTTAAPANKLKTELNPLEAGYGQIIDDKDGQPDVDTNHPELTLNPGTGGWRIHTRLRPNLLDFGTATSPDLQLPAASTCTNSCDQLHPSYNVIEKGRNGVKGGFYKIEIMGYTTGNFQKGSVHCVFEDDDNSTSGTVAEAYTGKPTTPSPVLLNVEAYYDIDCHRATDNNGKKNILLSVSGKTYANGRAVSRSETVEGTLTQTTTDSGATSTGGLDKVAPMNNRSVSVFGPKFAIGKKPDSQNTADSFNGLIDFVTLSTS